MNVVLRILKWIVGIVMSAILLVALISLYGYSGLSESVPTSVDDLVWTSITLETVTPHPTNVQFTAKEYRTIFSILVSPPPTDINELIQPGDHISVRIRREIADHLQSITMAHVYGLQLKSGQQIFDDTRLISTDAHIDAGVVKMIGIPILYFVSIIVLPVIWRKRRPPGVGS